MPVSSTLAPFGTTIFSEMTRLAQLHGAVNLAQGFPDFDGPQIAKQAAIDAINAGHSQYARMLGVPTLNKAIADAWTHRTGFHIDPDTHVTVTSGCTEAIPATLLGLLNPGDEIVMFEPFYDSYRACVALAGSTAKYVTLRPDASGAARGFGFAEDELRAAFTDKTRMVLLNTPHNPTGKVFTAAELNVIAQICVERDLIVVCDEVYEHLTYDPALPHISIATLPGMASRTVTLGSLGKSYNLTGWKVGWTIAWPELTAGVRAAHQFLTFATATPMQHGAAAIINTGEETIRQTRAMFMANRDKLAAALAEIGFRVFRSDGTYFLMVDHTPVSRGLGLVDDQQFCRWLVEHAKVAAIPPSVFYNTPSNGQHLARFAFCKKPETIDEAIWRLRKLTR